MFESYFKTNIQQYKLSGLFTVCNEYLQEGYETRLITLHLPEPYIKALDKLVDEKYYPNRAEAIRVAVRDLLNVEAWGRGPNNA